MKAFVRCGTAALLVVTLLLSLSGCGKVEKQFDFTNVAAIKVFTAGEQQVEQILDQEQAQSYIEQIGNITWKEQDEDTTEYDGWLYRVQCFSAKGEKKQNIYICSDSRILYRDAFWDAEDGALDTSVYDALFR